MQNHSELPSLSTSAPTSPASATVMGEAHTSVYFTSTTTPSAVLSLRCFTTSHTAFCLDILFPPSGGLLSYTECDKRTCPHRLPVVCSSRSSSWSSSASLPACDHIGGVCESSCLLVSSDPASVCEFYCDSSSSISLSSPFVFTSPVAFSFSTAKKFKNRSPIGNPGLPRS